MKQIIILFSGGLDSSCTIFLCARKIKIIFLLHVNHCLHKYSSFWEKHCKQISLLLGKYFYKLKLFIFANNNTQAWARKERYKFLYAFEKKIGKTYTILAHQQNDLIETYLLNIIKSNLNHCKGNLLKKKQMNKKIILLKPLINTTKLTIKKHCIKNKIKWLNDPSNEEILHYNRNKIRHRLIKIIKNDFNNYEKQTINTFYKQKNLQNKIKLFSY